MRNFNLIKTASPDLSEEAVFSPNNLVFSLFPYSASALIAAYSFRSV